MTPQEEQIWLSQVRTGGGAERERAREQLLAGLETQVLALCRRVIGDAHDAQDTAQDVLLTVHRHLDKFRAEARLSTWVYRIALRAALEARQRRLRLASEPLAEWDGGTATADSPEQQASSRQDFARLMRALDTLSAEHRAVLSLFAVEGLTHPQIADVLGIPEGTIWSRLHTARRKLRAALAGGVASP